MLCISRLVFKPISRFLGLTSASSRGVRSWSLPGREEFLRSLGPKVEQRLDDSSRNLVNSGESCGFSPWGYDGIEQKTQIFCKYLINMIN